MTAAAAPRTSQITSHRIRSWGWILPDFAGLSDVLGMASYWH